jgi:hypothetical protein
MITTHWWWSIRPPRREQPVHPRAVLRQLAGYAVPRTVVLDREFLLRIADVDARHEPAVVPDDELGHRSRQSGPADEQPQARLRR